MGRAELFGEYDPTPETFAQWDPRRLSSVLCLYDVENITLESITQS